MKGVRHVGERPEHRRADRRADLAIDRLSRPLQDEPPACARRRVEIDVADVVARVAVDAVVVAHPLGLEQIPSPRGAVHPEAVAVRARAERLRLLGHGQRGVVARGLRGAAALVVQIRQHAVSHVTAQRRRAGLARDRTVLADTPDGSTVRGARRGGGHAGVEILHDGRSHRPRVRGGLKLRRERGVAMAAEAGLVVRRVIADPRLQEFVRLVVGRLDREELEHHGLVGELDQLEAGAAIADLRGDDGHVARDRLRQGDLEGAVGSGLQLDVPAALEHQRPLEGLVVLVHHEPLHRERLREAAARRGRREVDARRRGGRRTALSTRASRSRSRSAAGLRPGPRACVVRARRDHGGHEAASEQRRRAATGHRAGEG
jgi:hypothetical protein